MIDFVVTLTAKWIEHRIRGCKNRFLVSSPFVGQFLPLLAARMRPSVEKRLLTRADLRDFAVGASDIDAVCEFARQGAQVHSVLGLHAKTYIVDDEWALVTSANATNGGMYRNWECGIAVNDLNQIDQLVKLVLSGFSSKQSPESWTLAELESLREPIRILKKQIAPLTRLAAVEDARVVAIKLGRRSKQELLSTFSGWLRLTLEAVLTQPDESFTLHEVYATCLPLIADRFPENRFPRQKVRQQLQRLRALGMLDFLGAATYRRTLDV